MEGENITGCLWLVTRESVTSLGVMVQFRGYEKFKKKSVFIKGLRTKLRILRDLGGEFAKQSQLARLRRETLNPKPEISLRDG
jgi:hypothetical protein